MREALVPHRFLETLAFDGIRYKGNLLQPGFHLISWAAGAKLDCTVGT
jgi:hypothetical protein